MDHYQWTEWMLNICLREQALARREKQLEQQLGIASAELERLIGCAVDDTSSSIGEVDIDDPIEYEVVFAHREKRVDQLIENKSAQFDVPSPKVLKTRAARILGNRIRQLKADSKASRQQARDRNRGEIQPRPLKIFQPDGDD